MIKKNIIFLIILALQVQLLAFEKVGTTSFQFLKVSTNARATAMGEAFSAVAVNSEDAYYNPAALTRIKKYDFSVAYTDWFLDIAHFSVTGAYTVDGFGTFGFQGVLADIGEIKETRIDELRFYEDGVYGGLTGNTLNPSSLSFGLSFARDLTEKFTFGITARYAREDLVVRAADNFMFDGGLIFQTGFKTLQLSATIRNFGSEVKFFDEEDLTFFDEEDSTYIQKYTGKGYPLPQTFNIGVAAYLIAPDEGMIMSSPSQTLIIAFDLVQPRDYDQQYNLGLEYGFRNLLFLRGGYKFNYDEESYSLGFGLNYSGYRIDYAYSDFGTYLNSVHRFSFGISID